MVREEKFVKPSFVDVYPNDMAIFLSIGVVRARFRESYKEAKLIKPGKIYEYTIEMNNIAIQFKKGHKVRLEISSSAFPYFLKNQNTGNDIGTDTESIVARQKIYHKKDFPSYLELPILSNQSIAKNKINFLG